MKSRTFTVTVDIDATPARVWSVMRDVEQWPTWTASISKAALLDTTTLERGGRVRVRQPKLPTAVWRVTDLDAARGFTWESRTPGAHITASHLIAPREHGTRVTLSLDYAGPVGRLVGRLYAGITERYMALEAAGLKRASETTR